MSPSYAGRIGDFESETFMQRRVLTKVPGAREVIIELAHQTHRPLEEVESVYEQQLDLLESYATVKAFVPVFAKRRAREVLGRY